MQTGEALAAPGQAPGTAGRSLSRNHRKGATDPMTERKTIKIRAGQAPDYDLLAGLLAQAAGDL